MPYLEFSEIQEINNYLAQELRAKGFDVKLSPHQIIREVSLNGIKCVPGLCRSKQDGRHAYHFLCLSAGNNDPRDLGYYRAQSLIKYGLMGMPVTMHNYKNIVAGFIRDLEADYNKTGVMEDIEDEIEPVDKRTNIRTSEKKELTPELFLDYVRPLAKRKKYMLNYKRAWLMHYLFWKNFVIVINVSYRFEHGEVLNPTSIRNMYEISIYELHSPDNQDNNYDYLQRPVSSWAYNFRHELSFYDTIKEIFPKGFIKEDEDKGVRDAGALIELIKKLAEPRDRANNHTWDRLLLFIFHRTQRATIERYLPEIDEGGYIIEENKVREEKGKSMTDNSVWKLLEDIEDEFEVTDKKTTIVPVTLNHRTTPDSEFHNKIIRDFKAAGFDIKLLKNFYPDRIETQWYSNGAETELVEITTTKNGIDYIIETFIVSYSEGWYFEKNELEAIGLDDDNDLLHEMRFLSSLSQDKEARAAQIQKYIDLAEMGTAPTPENFDEYPFDTERWSVRVFVGKDIIQKHRQGKDLGKYGKDYKSLDLEDIVRPFIDTDNIPGMLMPNLWIAVINEIEENTRD